MTISNPNILVTLGPIRKEDAITNRKYYLTISRKVVSNFPSTILIILIATVALLKLYL
jgi:hypothetical protein